MSKTGVIPLAFSLDVHLPEIFCTVSQKAHYLFSNEFLCSISIFSGSPHMYQFSLALFFFGGFPGAASGKESSYQCRRHKRHGFNPRGQEDPLEEGMATHSSIFALRIPWTEEPGELQSIGSQSWTRLKQLSTAIYLYSFFFFLTL